MPTATHDPSLSRRSPRAGAQRRVAGRACRRARRPGDSAARVPDSVVARVQRLDHAPGSTALAWGVTGGRTILFQVDERAAQELQAAIDAGDEPRLVVESDCMVAFEIA